MCSRIAFQIFNLPPSYLFILVFILSGKSSFTFLVQGNGDVGFPLPSFHQQDVFQRVLMDVGNESSMTCPSEDERLQIITASYIGFAPNCSHVHEFTKHRASPNCAGIELESIIKDICNERSHCSVPQEIIAKLCNETNLDLNVIYQCIGFASSKELSFHSTIPPLYSPVLSEILYDIGRTGGCFLLPCQGP